MESGLSTGGVPPASLQQGDVPTGPVWLSASCPTEFEAKEIADTGMDCQCVASIQF